MVIWWSGKSGGVSTPVFRSPKKSKSISCAKCSSSSADAPDGKWQINMGKSVCNYINQILKNFQVSWIVFVLGFYHYSDQGINRQQDYIMHFHCQAHKVHRDHYSKGFWARILYAPVSENRIWIQFDFNALRSCLNRTEYSMKNHLQWFFKKSQDLISNRCVI